MRSHPVSGNSGLPILLSVELGVGMDAGAGLVEEEEEEEEEGEGICAGWAAATSAAWTLGTRKQKEGGLALWMRPCSRPVLRAPRGAESACRLHGARPVPCCSGCITLQLASGCGGEAETHGRGLGCCTARCFDLSSILKTNSLKAKWNTGTGYTGCPAQQLLNGAAISKHTGHTSRIPGKRLLP